MADHPNLLAIRDHIRNIPATAIAAAAIRVCVEAGGPIDEPAVRQWVSGFLTAHPRLRDPMPYPPGTGGSWQTLSAPTPSTTFYLADFYTGAEWEGRQLEIFIRMTQPGRMSVSVSVDNDLVDEDDLSEWSDDSDSDDDDDSDSDDDDDPSPPPDEDPSPPPEPSRSPEPSPPNL
jgi:hypothetical protein